MRHELIGFFGGCVQGHRVVHLVIRGVRHLLVAAVDRAGRCIHQMLHGIIAAGFQNVIEANHVTLDVGVRVGDGVTHTSLSTQIDHNIRMVLLKNAVDKYLVRKVALDKGIVFKFLKLRKASFLDANVVIVVHVVQTNDLGIRLGSQDTLGKVGANETGRTCDKNCFFHHFHSYPFLHTILLTTFT